MSKVNCRCGWQISNVCSPSINNGWLMSDIALDFPEDEKKDSCEIMDMCIDVWECRECGAIAFGKKKSNDVVWYYPEEKPAQALMERAT